MNSEDTDVIFVPLSLSFSFINPRHSYPPLRCLSTMPVQHIMRSYSDSHLFLKLAAATAVDGGVGEDEDRTSWYSGGELWDMDYVQHWLRLDETRTAIQQRMEYDAAELEDWTMDDGAGWKRLLATDGKQQSLPCIEEDDGKSSVAAGGRRDDHDDDLLSGSTKDMSWHHFQHFDHHYRRDVSLQQHQNGLDQRPVASSSCGSGGESWSSADEYAAADSPPSKRSSSSCSDSVDLLPPPGPIAGTDFTRDFYRLVKFESSKSLASTSSKSVTGCEYRKPAVDETQPDREQALQSVLDFIAEQQQYCLSRQAEDKPATFVTSAGVCSDTVNAPTPAVDRVRADDDTVTTADRPTLTSDKLTLPATLQHQQTCDSNSCSDNLLNSKDSGLCGSDLEIECLPEDCYEASCPTATSTPRSTLLRTVPEEEDDDEDEESAKSTSPQPPSTGAGGSSSVCTAETTVMASAWTATSSKDLIDQLNRMAGVRSPHDTESGDLFDGHALEDGRTRSFPVADLKRHSPSSLSTTDLDEACCCPTGWVHLERDIDFTDPKVCTNR